MKLLVVTLMAKEINTASSISLTNGGVCCGKD